MYAYAWIGTLESMTETITIRRPTAAAGEDVSAPTFTVDGPLEGLRVGLRTDLAWRSWQLIADIWADYLRRDGAHPVTVETSAQVGDTASQDRSHIEQLAEDVDCAIVGLGTCGSCTSFAIADAVIVEKHRKPSIAVVADEFATHGHNMARHLGHGDLKILVLPYPLEARPEHELREIADTYYPTALKLLGVRP